METVYQIQKLINIKKITISESNSTDGIKADEEINDTNKTGDDEETDDAEETLQYLNQL